MQELHNPLLLEVKMFLAELPWIRHQQYQYPFKVCTHFTKDVFDAATNRGMRCACALVIFEGVSISHAIVAFQTDHGLIYIEPQSGEQEAIVIGKPYPTPLERIPVGCIVNGVEQLWNDEVRVKWLDCQNEDCRYLLPTLAITDYCPACNRNTNTRLLMSCDES